MAFHKWAATHAHPEDKTRGKHLPQRARRASHRRRLTFPYHRDSRPRDQPLGLAEYVRSANERISAEGLGEPQRAVAQMFQLAGEAGDFAGTERVEVGKDAKFSWFHAHSFGERTLSRKLAPRQIVRLGKRL